MRHATFYGRRVAPRAPRTRTLSPWRRQWKPNRCRGGVEQIFAAPLSNRSGQRWCEAVKNGDKKNSPREEMLSNGGDPPVYALSATPRHSLRLLRGGINGLLSSHTNPERRREGTLSAFPFFAPWAFFSVFFFVFEIRLSGKADNVRSLLFMKSVWIQGGVINPRKRSSSGYIRTSPLEREGGGLTPV